MATLQKLEKGIIFNKIGSWYNKIVDVIQIDEPYAFCKIEEDDGFVKYMIFEKRNEGWISILSSTDFEYFYTNEYKTRATHTQPETR